jgi:quercetin dioxygenase-like cupin family protein
VTRDGGAAALAVILVLAGCPGGGAKPPGVDPGDGDGGGSGGTDVAPTSGPDARVVGEDERLAMIAHAMNELAPVASQCWAAGAVDDYRLAGEVTLAIAPHGDGARVSVARDTTGDAVLSGCLQQVASAYGWRPELAGEVIELPFAFTAPNGQNVIDRRLVPMNAQAGVGVGVIVDAKNSGNAAASVYDVTIPAKGAVALAQAERHEVWYVTSGEGWVTGPVAERQRSTVVAGSVVDVPAGAYRGVTAGTSGLSAAVFVVPGQVEGVARGGALPGKTVFASDTVPKSAVGPKVIAVGTEYKADKRAVYMFLDSAAKGASPDVALEVLALDAGAAVPEHVHAKETEILYVLAGAGTMVVDGVTLPVDASSVVQIPANVTHAASVTAAFRAIQLYTPGGPEQRFKKPPDPR